MKRQKRGKSGWSRRRFLAVGVGGGAMAVCLPVRFGLYDPPDEFEDLVNFSPTQGLILIYVLDAMLPPDAHRSRARFIDHVRFIDGYMVGLEERTIQELGMLLHLIEHMTLPLAASPVRFSRLSREEQISYLRAWQTSNVGMLRLGLRSLKTLVFMAYYRTVESFRTISYPGPIIGAVGAYVPNEIRYARLVAPDEMEPSFS